MKKRLNLVLVFLSSASVACGVMACGLAILGGPSGPPGCPNGTMYGPDAGTCCPAGNAVDMYGVCQSNVQPVTTAWGAKRIADAGLDAR